MYPDDSKIKKIAKNMMLNLSKDQKSNNSVTLGDHVFEFDI